MKRPRRAAVAAGALLVLAVDAAPACELVLSEHRSGLELLRLPMPIPVPTGSVLPTFRIAFTHSVLGTPVEDRYAWRHHDGHWQAHLVEERFEGQGYGLPHAAEAGEVLERDGKGTRLRLDRRVFPLVVRPLPAQGMRVIIDSVPPSPAVRLGALSAQAIELQLAACDPR